MTISDLLVLLAADILVVPIALLGGIAMLRLPGPKRYQLIARGVCTGLIALFFAKLASLFYQGGARPFEQLGVEPLASYLPNAGFPSDHSLFVFTITVVVWASTKNRALSVTLLVMSIIVAAGRVAALVHSPWDVLGGMACALLAGLVMYGSTLWRLEKDKAEKNVR